MISFKTLLALVIALFIGYLFMFGTIPEFIDTMLFYIENTSLSDLLFSNIAVIGIGALAVLVFLLFVGHQAEKKYF